MVEEVEITNFGKGGVASEETLADLVKAVEYLAKKEGFDPKKTADKIKELSENLDESIDVIDENRKAIEENTDAVNDSTKSYNRAFGFIGQAIGAVGTSLFNFSAELIDGGSKLTDFAQHIPVFGSVISRFTGYFDDTIEVFREISSVGGAMNNSLTDIRMAAAQTFMSLDEFRNFVIKNSTQLSVMGGTVTKGVKRLTELNAALGDQRLELLNMGYSYQEINDALVRYAYLDRAGRRAQQINVAQQAAAAADYAKNLSTLSKLTGKEIESIEEKVQANTADIAFQQKLARMSPAERQKVLNAMAEATEIYGDAGAEFFKQQILGMPPLTEETAMLAAAFPELANQIRGLATDAQDTRISLEQFNQGSTDRLVEAVRAAAEAGEDFETLLAAGAAGLDGPATTLANILQGMGMQFTDFIDEDGNLREEALRNAIESAKSETDERNQLTNSLLQFEDSIRKARQEILTNFIDSGVFDLITDTVQGLADTMSDPEFVGALKDAIIDVTNFFSGLIEDIKTMGFWAAIKNGLIDGFSGIWEEIKLKLFGGTRDNTEQIQRAEERLSELRERQSQLRSRDARGEDIGTELESVSASIERLLSERQRLEETSGQQVEGMFPNLGKILGFDRPDNTQAIADIDRQIQEKQEELSSGDTNRRERRDLRSEIAQLEAQKEELEDDGLLSGITSVFSNLGDLLAPTGTLLIGLGALAVGLNLIGVKGSLAAGALGLAAGGVGYALNGVSNIMDSMTARTEATTDQIERLSAIPGSNLQDAADGIEAMKKALDGFEPSFWEGLGDWFTGGITQDSMTSTTQSIEKIAETVGNLDANKIQAGSDAVSNLGIALSSFNAATTISDAGDLAARIIGYEDLVNSFVTLASELEKIEDPTKLSAVSASMDSVIGILDKFKDVTIPANLSELAAGLLGTTDFTSQLVTLAKGLEPIDGSKLQQVAPGVEAISNALEIFRTSAGFSGLGDYVSSFFDEDTSEIGAKISQIAIDLQQIDAAKLSEASAGIITMSEAFNTFATSEAGSFNVSRSSIRNLEKISELPGTGFRDVADGLTALASIDINRSLETINSGFNTDNIVNYTSALQELIETLEELNETMSQPERQSTTSNSNVSDATARGSNFTSADQLNIILQKLYEETIKTNDFAKKIEKNTKSFGRDVSTGRVSDL